MSDICEELDVTEGVSHDKLREGSSRRTKRKQGRSQAVWQLVAGHSKDRGCKVKVKDFQRAENYDRYDP